MAKKIKKYKVGMDSETYAISLVESPAIEEDFVHLSKEEEEKVFLESNEKHMVYGAVLVPDKDIYRNNGENEFYISFSKESIEKMSQDFMKEYHQWEVKLDHEEIANEVCVVESWIKYDLYKDKSVALGLNENLPVGTWFAGMKVNNIEAWERIKSGELKGFSVESMIRLEEFNKVENNDTMEVNESFWSKLKNILFEALGKEEKEEVIEEEVNIEENLEEEQPTEVPPVEPIVEEPTVESPVEEKPAEEPKNEPEVKPEEVKEEPKKEDNHLEDLINNLKAEIEALKEVNSGLQAKVKDLGKTPSTKPVSTNAKPNPKDTYAAWREQMRAYIS